MSMWDPLSSAAFGVVPVGSTYPTMSPIGAVGKLGRPTPGLLSSESPMMAFGVVLALTVLGFFAASYEGTLRVGPFKVGGSASAGSK